MEKRRLLREARYFTDQFNRYCLKTFSRCQLGFRLNHSQNATRVAKATAERKFLASLS